jgi:CBS domain containing-hemolysin-like protein
VRHAVEHIDAYLAACQLGITLASIGLGVVGKPVFEELLKPVLGDAASVGGFGVAAAVAFSIITLLHVVVGELAPKSLAIARTSRTVLLVAPWMRAFYLATKPVVDLFNAMGNLLLKPFGVPPASESGHVPHSEAELRTLLRQSEAKGLIDPDDQELTENVFAFGDRRAREVMVPRGEIDVITTRCDVPGAVERAIETGHTRFPLCEPDGGLDDAVGVVHVKDLLPAALAEGRETDLRKLARRIARVPESILLGELLRELRREQQHMALVLDEHGTVVGAVTLEDVLEELVGEIEDEFDVGAPEQIERDGDATLVDGATSIRLLTHELDIEIEDPHEATIGGHVLELLGRLPEVGEAVELDGVQAEVAEVGDARITKLRITARRRP